MTATPCRCSSGPPADRVGVVPVQALTATFDAFRSFATTVGRLQVDLLHAVAEEHAQTEQDLADWALEMYGQLRRAVELHTHALGNLVPADPGAPARSGSQSWVEDSAAELGRVLNTLIHDDGALIGLLLGKAHATHEIALPLSDREAA
jgi:hypothetical protein